VELHWIGRQDWDEPVLRIAADNRISEPERRRGPEQLPLEENAWNNMEIALRDGLISLSLNGTQIYERPAEKSNHRMCGLYHHPQFAAKVRSAKLAGPWPETLSDEVRSNLFAVSTPLSAVDQRIASEILTDECLAPEASAIVERARASGEAEGLELLKQWVLPSSRRGNYRLYYEFASPNAADGAHSNLVCPAVEMLQLAERLNQLPALREEINKLSATNPTGERNKQALLTLAALTQNEHEQVASALTDFASTAKENLPKTLPRRDRAAEFLVAWEASEEAELVDAATELAQQLRKLERDKKLRSGDGDWNAELALLSGRLQLARLKSAEDKLGEPLQQWKLAATENSHRASKGYAADHWLSTAEGLDHIPAAMATQLYFQSPLTGKFEIHVTMSPRQHDALAVGCGFHAALLQNDLKGKQLLTLPTFARSVPQELKLKKLPELVDYRIVVDGSKVTTFAEGEQLHEEVLVPQPDPWVVLQAVAAENEGKIASLRIEGEPTIPAEIKLIESAGWAGWDSSRFGESISAAGPDENAAWQHVGEEIVGQASKSEQVSPSESLIFYKRPLLEDGVIKYEAFYEPQASMVHPAVGEHALIVSPQGVSLHQLTRGRWETRGLQPDNSAPLTNSATAVPLKENGWNDFHIETHGDRLTLSVNSEKVAELDLTDPPSTRRFGLFRYGNETGCRVKNLVYRGQWPTKLPAVADQELAQAGGP
jgi:hypothetical protein